MPFGPDRQLPSDFVVQPLTSRKPRHKFTEGRRPGSQNKFTRDVKAAVLQAAHNVGDGENPGLIPFLEDTARRHRKAFIMLLAKMLPLKIGDDGPAGGGVVQVNVLSIPTDNYLTGEDLKRFQHPAGAGLEPVIPAQIALEGPAPVTDTFVAADKPATADESDLSQLRAGLKSLNALLDEALADERR